MKIINWLVAIVFVSVCANASILDIKDSANRPVLIGIVPFDVSGAKKIDFEPFLQDNFNISGRIKPLDKIPQSKISSSEQIDVDKWAGNGAEYVIFGKVVEIMPDRYNIKAYLFDVVEKRIVWQEDKAFSSKEQYDLADSMSNDIYFKITGKRGMFSSKLAYVEETPVNRQKSIYRIVVSNPGGFNKKVLFQSYFPIISLNWFPDNQKLIYVSFEGNLSSIYIHDLLTNARKRVNLSNKTTSSPHIVDNESMYFVVSRNGGSEIMYWNMNSNTFKKVVGYEGLISTEPYQKNGNLLFTTERYGNPHIAEYVGLKEVNRITYSGAFNNRARYYKDDKILFIKQSDDGKMSLNMFDKTGGEFTQLTFGDNVEAYSLSPDEEYIVYTQVSSFPRGSRLKIMHMATGAINDFKGNNASFLREAEWSR